jgi:DNA-binding response OmpR family regulator
MNKLKVLIADDISSFRKFIEYTISQNYLNVETEMATNGLDAKRKLESNQYDLVLCDWGMPQMSGIDLLKWLRNHPTLHKIAFVMITANGDEEAVKTATKLGATAYILKPISMNQLIAKLATILSTLNK